MTCSTCKMFGNFIKDFILLCRTLRGHQEAELRCPWVQTLQHAQRFRRRPQFRRSKCVRKSKKNIWPSAYLYLSGQTNCEFTLLLFYCYFTHSSSHFPVLLLKKLKSISNVQPTQHELVRCKNIKAVSDSFARMRFSRSRNAHFKSYHVPKIQSSKLWKKDIQELKEARRTRTNQRSSNLVSVHLKN